MTNPAPDEKQTEAKFKAWMSEVLDTREQAAAAKAEEDRKAAEKAEAEKPRAFSLFDSLFGR